MIKNKYTCLAAALLLGLSTQSMAADWGFAPLPFKVPEPADNPSTAAKVQLGKQLFFDPRLSKDDTLSCNFCHDVAGNGTDSRSTSIGVDGQLGGRSAPTVWNAAFLSSQFWDGRAASLEEQAKGPILNPIEMGVTHEAAAVERIASIPGYVEQFKEIFGGENPVTYNNIAKAIATYERTLITPNALFDQYLRGDKTALNKKALAGMKEFENLGCIRCHNGPNFAGPMLDKGEVFYQYFPANRSEYDKLLGLQEDQGHRNNGEDKTPSLWRVPSLRNIALTAPYFHNGSVPTLNKAVRVMAKVQLNRDITDEQADRLEAFLETLTGEFTVQRPPKLPPG
ncbi:MAG TPA: cytochrome-c peroxidase [Candidatus Tenderia electrophaga]|uniref:Methylamine utilization protein MauG n=1 Tax=Candidatus Tenderia electrophaga TaxID=1748243 RepID=A0A832J5N3_9GAMM|nr:cytochrome-c peroxidase [Candidatus Tenderia electrophaga]